jgi:hypothetical protein
MRRKRQPIAAASPKAQEQERRERNKLAAMDLRRRKQNYEDKLRDTVEQLRAEHERLEARERELQSKNGRMQEQLTQLEHSVRSIELMAEQQQQQQQEASDGAPVQALHHNQSMSGSPGAAAAKAARGAAMADVAPVPRPLVTPTPMVVAEDDCEDQAVMEEMEMENSAEASKLGVSAIQTRMEAGPAAVTETKGVHVAQRSEPAVFSPLPSELRNMLPLILLLLSNLSPEAMPSLQASTTASADSSPTIASDLEEASRRRRPTTTLTSASASTPLVATASSAMSPLNPSWMRSRGSARTPDGTGPAASTRSTPPHPRQPARAQARPPSTVASAVPQAALSQAATLAPSSTTFMSTTRSSEPATGSDTPASTEQIYAALSGAFAQLVSTMTAQVAALAAAGGPAGGLPGGLPAAHPPRLSLPAGPVVNCSA